MTTSSFRSGNAWVAAVLIAGCGLVPAACAQGSAEEVHIAPRIERPRTQNDHPIDDPAMATQTTPIKVDVNPVLVSVSVVDPLNRQVIGLDKENFQVFEGKDREQILHFSSEDAPISLGAIFDLSGSMASKIDRAREAVVEFFKTANPQDEFFMIEFADKPEDVTDFTQSVENIEGRLVYTAPKGPTALLDAIYLGLTKMREAKYRKKALLLISHGGDNHIRYTESEIKSLFEPHWTPNFNRI
jgi:Ca-activated chloride channel family protein